MEIRKSEHKDRVVLEVRGEIEVFTLPILQKKAESCLGGAEEVLLDLKELVYIDSAGLGYLVNLNDRLQARHQRLTLANLQSHVEKTFRIMHLDKILEIRKTEELV